MENVNEQAKTEKMPVNQNVAPKPAPPAAPAPRPVFPPDAGEASDIFSDIKEQPVQPMMGTRAPKGEAATIETPQRGFKKILITIGSLVIFAGALAGGGYWAYNQFLKPQPLSPNLNLNVNLGANTGAAAETGGQAEAAAEAATTTQTVVSDSDNDGLSDEKEQALGTDYLNPDTDGDKLFDREEAEVYKTNPLVKDTDGDGFEDGAEVQAGYDPNGPGKLIKIPAGS